MKSELDKHRRISFRLPRYDYAQPGAYFVTTCIHQRLCLLGAITDSTMRLNPAGQMVYRWWTELPDKFPCLTLDEFIIMPNHLHGILVISPSDDSRVGAALGGRPPDAAQDGRPPRGAPANHLSLFAILDWFKTMTTNEYIRGVNDNRWPPFDRHVWQRGYHDHIIRNERELDAIRVYILANPSRWAVDLDNPIRFPKFEPPKTIDDYLRDAHVP